ncbi:hypothetical protein H4R23_006624, partial [Coemansia sp. Cherry 401B]
RQPAVRRRARRPRPRGDRCALHGRHHQQRRVCAQRGVRVLRRQLHHQAVVHHRPQRHRAPRLRPAHAVQRHCRHPDLAADPVRQRRHRARLRRQAARRHQPDHHGLGQDRERLELVAAGLADERGHRDWRRKHLPAGPALVQVRRRPRGLQRQRPDPRQGLVPGRLGLAHRRRRQRRRVPGRPHQLRRRPRRPRRRRLRDQGRPGLLHPRLPLHRLCRRRRQPLRLRPDLARRQKQRRRPHLRRAPRPRRRPAAGRPAGPANPI